MRMLVVTLLATCVALVTRVDAAAPPAGDEAAAAAQAAPSAPTAQEMTPPEPLPAETKPEDFVYVAATRPDRIGRIMAPVWVNGVGPFAFVVDTGASSTVVSPRVARRLDLRPDPAKSMRLRGITGSEVVSSVSVTSINAGGITLPPKQLPVVEPRVFADADGIFGADAFASGCLYANFAKAEVMILKNACPRVSSNWETERVELRFGGLPVARARIGNTRVLAIIDTGAERSLGNPALLAASGRDPDLLGPETLRQVHAATSQEVFGHLIPVAPISLGQIEIGNLQLVFGDFEVFRMWGAAETPAVVLGMDVLGTTQALMIDYRRGELRLLPQGAQNTLRLRPNTTPTRLP